MTKFKVGQRVKLLDLHKEFPQLIPSDCDKGVVEAVRTVYGIDIVLVALDTGEIKKLPAIFLTALQLENRTR